MDRGDEPARPANTHKGMTIREELSMYFLNSAITAGTAILATKATAAANAVEWADALLDELYS